MYYYEYKNSYPDDVLVYIEDYNRKEGIVVFDFVDSNELFLFSESIENSFDISSPSMVLMKNYRGKSIRANTVYSIKISTIQSWLTNDEIFTKEDDSYLFGFIINLSDNSEIIFANAVSINKFTNSFYLNNIAYGRGKLPEINFSDQKILNVVIRNVGQGNWNEVYVNNSIKVAYDMGAPMTASKSSVRLIIGDKSKEYKLSKPILVLSHWDKDHYHSLIGMNDEELGENFSFFICRDQLPNLTSRILFSRLKNAIGIDKTITISADLKIERGGPTILRNLNPISDTIVVFNAQQNKDRNKSGLALLVKTQNTSVILSGDLQYEQISRDILSNLNYRHMHNLIVPHHGGEAGRFIYALPYNVKAMEAIISVGVNMYDHPLESNLNRLRCIGFKIKRTNFIGRDIVINF